MNAQIISKAGKKEYAVIPYKVFLRMQEQLEELDDIKALRKAKAEPDYQKRRPYEEVAKEMGLMK
ncbi:MAG: type II toxin-antitoxin system Phd/YefM family antitoxin [Planctomycetota bacterium]